MLDVGDVAPNFILPDENGNPLELRLELEKSPIALMFFPFAFSGRCSGELCELRDNLDLFRNQHVRVLGVSVDSRYALAAWSEQEAFGFPLLSDAWPHGVVARGFGVFVDDRGVADRATFLIGTDGLIRARFVTSLSEARPIEAYRGALAAL